MTVEAAPAQGKARTEVVRVGRDEKLLVEFIEGEDVELPLLSIRDPKNISRIADLACSGKPVVFEAAGVFGLLAEVKNTNKPNGAGKVFWFFKQRRDPLDKIPIMCLPEYAATLVNMDKLNHEVRKVISDGKKRKGFWGLLPLHVIMPVIDRVPLVHPQTFITTPDESRLKGLEFVPEPTICLYFQQDDDWISLARSIHLRAPYSLFGVSSLNDSGEHPPYDLDELKSYLPLYQELSESISGVSYDPATWNCDIASSQTQVRLPLWHEEPILTITRPGPVTAEMLEEHTGFKTRILENAKHAKSKHPNGYDFSFGVNKYISQSTEMIKNRKLGLAPPLVSENLTA